MARKLALFFFRDLPLVFAILLVSYVALGSFALLTHIRPTLLISIPILSGVLGRLIFKFIKNPPVLTLVILTFVFNFVVAIDRPDDFMIAWHSADRWKAVVKLYSDLGSFSLSQHFKPEVLDYARCAGVMAWNLLCPFLLVYKKTGAPGH